MTKQKFAEECFRRRAWHSSCNPIAVHLAVG
jgi:hypothetical protein